MDLDDQGAPPPAGRTGAGGVPAVEVVLPVRNEERRLEAGVRGLRAHLDGPTPPSPGRRCG